MSRKPKYSETTQRLVNACQVIEQLPGAVLTIPLDAASGLAKYLPPAEFAMFDFRENGKSEFVVTLKA